jgi:hypothetical protein
MITILCADEKSNYFKFDELEIYTKKENAYNFNGSNKIIAHPPCQQWSRLKHFATKNDLDKQLAIFCYEKILLNGGILEHPLHSSLWKYLGIKPTVNIQMNWFNLPVKKMTGLYFNKCQPLEIPFNLDAISHSISNSKNYKELPKSRRSETTIELAQWLIDCINESAK